jgi:hypothetical protein
MREWTVTEARERAELFLQVKQTTFFVFGFFFPFG